jgi:hypothetical protein
MCATTNPASSRPTPNQPPPPPPIPVTHRRRAWSSSLYMPPKATISSSFHIKAISASPPSVSMVVRQTRKRAPLPSAPQSLHSTQTSMLMTVFSRPRQTRERQARLCTLADRRRPLLRGPRRSLRRILALPLHCRVLSDALDRRRRTRRAAVLVSLKTLNGCYCCQRQCQCGRGSVC